MDRCCAGVARLFAEFAHRALLGRFAGIDPAGRQLGHDLTDAVLVLPHENDVLVGRQREHDAKAVRLADEIIFNDRAARKFDTVRAQA